MLSDETDYWCLFGVADLPEGSEGSGFRFHTRRVLKFTPIFLVSLVTSTIQISISPFLSLTTLAHLSLFP